MKLWVESLCVAFSVHFEPCRGKARSHIVLTIVARCSCNGERCTLQASVWAMAVRPILLTLPFLFASLKGIKWQMREINLTYLTKKTTRAFVNNKRRIYIGHRLLRPPHVLFIVAIVRICLGLWVLGLCVCMCVCVYVCTFVGDLLETHRIWRLDLGEFVYVANV